MHQIDSGIKSTSPDNIYEDESNGFNNRENNASTRRRPTFQPLVERFLKGELSSDCLSDRLLFPLSRQEAGILIKIFVSACSKGGIDNDSH